MPDASTIRGAKWKKSRRSGSNEGQCVEVADVRESYDSIAVRDSKRSNGPAILLTPAVFTALITGLKHGPLA